MENKWIRCPNCLIANAVTFMHFCHYDGRKKNPDKTRIELIVGLR